MNTIKTLKNEWSIENKISIEEANTYGNKTKKYIWKCTKNETHIWEARLNKRLLGNNCPHCNGDMIETNNLLLKRPDLCEEFDYEKNNITPDKIKPNEQKNIWWKCKKGHSWKATPYNRNIGNTECPYCKNKLASSENNLLSINPEKCKEWDYIKNKVNPENYLPNSNKKVYWICEKKHSWFQSISSKTCCPICFKGRHTSLMEESIKYYLSKYFEITELILGKKKKVDIFIDRLNLIIEYDGYYYHKDKIDKDQKWSNCMRNKKYDVLRIREQLPAIKDVNNYIVDKYSEKQNDITIKYIFSFINDKYKMELNIDDINFYRDKYKIYNTFSFNKKNSLSSLRPDLMKEWSTNNILNPDQISTTSSMVVEWCCEKNHFWKAQIRHRVGTINKKGTGCPYCCKQKISIEDSILTTNPDILNIFVDSKYKLEDIHNKSSKKIKIKCVNNHEYEIEVRKLLKNKKCKYCNIKLLN